MTAHKKQIVVLGAGFGGLEFARRFRHKDAEITIVDRRNHHLFQPLLYQVATAGLAMPDVAEPVRTIFSKRDDVKVLLDEVSSIDLENKQVRMRHRDLSFDTLVIALGMRTSYFGHDEWSKHAFGLKSLTDARRIRQHVLEAFERAEAISDPAERQRLMTTVVAGAGPTGLELAGTLAELTKRVFRRDFREIRPEDSRIILVEAMDRTLPMYEESSSRRAQAALEKIGVELRLGSMVQDIRPGQVVLENETLEAGTIIWTAGVESVPVVRDLPVEQDKKGRLMVARDTSLPGHPQVFAIGDIVNLKDARGKPVPGVSPAAIQMGRHVARIVHEELSGKKNTSQRTPFRYRDKGQMATIGRSSAVAEIGKTRFSGFPAWFLWLGVHLAFLIGFRNRLAVLLQWFYAYLRFRPGARVFESPSDRLTPPRDTQAPFPASSRAARETVSADPAK